jgi:hypothetical protein
MPKWADERERLKKLLAANIPDDEPCTRMIFPRREAAKRKKSTEKHHKIVFRCDETTYQEFHEHRERILRLLDDNPILYGVFITDVQKSFSEALVSQWRAIHDGPGESSNPAVPKASIPQDDIPVEPLSDAAEQSDEDFILGRQGLDDA